jgi:hypothetical protein
VSNEEDDQQFFVKGYRAGWKQCVNFIETLSDLPGETLGRVQKAMEITERNFIPRPYKDSEKDQGRNAYSDEGPDQGQ